VTKIVTVTHTPHQEIDGKPLEKLAPVFENRPQCRTQQGFAKPPDGTGKKPLGIGYKPVDTGGLVRIHAVKRHTC